MQSLTNILKSFNNYSRNPNLKSQTCPGFELDLNVGRGIIDPTAPQSNAVICLCHVTQIKNGVAKPQTNAKPIKAKHYSVARIYRKL